LPPPDQLQAKAAQLRQAVPDDPKIIALCDAIEEMVAHGWIVRHGGGEATESRRWPMHELWKKPPPERP
jgi:hypothetical protein